jgi:two-component system, OmpR family, sensor kinase
VFKTLYGKLSAALLLLFACIGVLFVLVTLFTTRGHLREMNQRLNRSLAGHIASEMPLLRGGGVNEGATRELFQMLMAVNPGIEVYLLDRNGTILSYSAPPGKVKRATVSLAPIRRFLTGSEALPILGDDPRDPERRKVFSAARIPADGPDEGYLYIILGGEEYDTVSRMLQASYIAQLSLWAVGGGVLFVLLAGLILFYRLTFRHRRLTAAVASFQESGFRRYPEVRGRFDAERGDEIDRLGAAFSQMAERIVGQIAELRDADTMRRELVTHVSHDLRTPLTSLQGYLETLALKEGKLSAEERKEYLETALRHSRRLSTLVSELFELALLDAPDVTLRAEPFSLGDLVQDVLQKFRLAADAKRIGLRATVEEGIPFAFGDVGRIDRVLENLVGNALRHAPQQGEIIVTVRRTDTGLSVGVSDNGSGIPPERLARLFDTGPTGRGEADRDAEGAGLGLVIARKIVTLHGGELTVESAVGIGTRFAFTLPVHPRR